MIDDALRLMVESPTRSNLEQVYRLLVSSKVLAVTDGTLRPDKKAGGFRFKLLSIPLPAGGSALPIFTSKEHLNRWKGDPVPSIPLPGKNAFALAQTMKVDAVVINHQSDYKGRIDQQDFQSLAAGVTSD